MKIQYLQNVVMFSIHNKIDYTFVSTSCGRDFLTCSCTLKNAKEGSLAIIFILSDILSVTEK
jgi:hypothetical protein